MACQRLGLLILTEDCQIDFEAARLGKCWAVNNLSLRQGGEGLVL